MTDPNGRRFARSEDRTTRYRVYPVAGEPAEGDGVRVNAALDLEFAAGTAFAGDDILTEDGNVLVDDATGNVLVEG